jgi:hypothetical protein
MKEKLRFLGLDVPAETIGQSVVYVDETGKAAGHI